MAKFDELGREIPETTPVAVPSGWSRPLSLQEEIRRAIRGELSRQAAAEGQETFEESDDFDVDEDGDPLSPYEIPEGLPEALGGAESLDGSESTSEAEKSPTEAKNPVSADLRKTGHPSTDSGTEKPPAGKGS